MQGASQVAFMVKNLLPKAGDTRDVGLIPGLVRSPGKGNGNPLQYSCLEISLDRGVRQVTVHGAAKSWTRPRIYPCTDFVLLYFVYSASQILPFFFFFFYRLQLCSNLSPCTSVSTFSSTIYSLHISMPHFGNSCNTLSSLTIALIRVVWDQGSLMLPLPKYYYSLKSQRTVNISEK